MANDTQAWKVDTAEFQGYVRAKLEENTIAHKAIFTKLDTQGVKIGENETALAGLKVKSGITGGASGGVMAFIISMVKSLWN